jgi:glycosyltransferase involved in cell wall biosynthesis
MLAPFPPGAVPAHGGSIAIAELVKSLSRRHRVALAYLRAEDEAAADPALAKLCDAVFESRRPGVSVSSIRPLHRVPRWLPLLFTGYPLWVASRWSAEFKALVAEILRSWRPDIVQAEFGAMGVYLPAARASNVRTVVTFHDSTPLASSGDAKGGRSIGHLIWSIEAVRWRNYDRKLLQSVDAAVALTDRDARALAALDGRLRVTTIPLGVTMPFDRANPIGTEPPLLLFVGNFIHPPNVDAASYLLDTVLPCVRKSHPAVQLALVGDHAPAWLRARAGGAVHVPGFVPDLRPLMNAAAIVVAPIRKGGGMRVKVLDAMAAGKAIVGTSLAFEGLRVTSGEHAIVADDDASMCEAIRRLLADEREREALGRAARAHVAASFSWEQTALAYEAVYDRLLSSVGAAAQR